MNNAVDRIATWIAETIIRNYPGSSSIAVLKYSLIPRVQLMICIIFILLVGAASGHLFDSLVACIGMPLLSRYSGGFHFKSMTMCSIVSTILILLAIYLPIHFGYDNFILTGLSLLILLITAPCSDLDNEGDYLKLKIISVLIVAVNFLFMSDVLAKGFFLQSLLTIRFFHKFIDRF